ncbi:O-antigen ligase family protein [Sphingomonas turrisvirgatae]|uniref:O-antigen ligase-related domain-containing protein n=1 Tax=Sphingomonas turrisvirgatae TaxID=1888892 RepID=A0A1E3LRW8_9SPHN|nr:O-antigen ligase family protein [Sphingomonas turrisvirgatae]ODP36464.1 hypothetical protein BFL28_05605 [Sphingomonas turrisvirgatae]
MSIGSSSRKAGGAAVALRNRRLVRNRADGAIGETPLAGTQIAADMSPLVVAPPASPLAKAALGLFIVTLFLPNIYSLGPINLSPTLILLAIAFIPLLAMCLLGKPYKIFLPDYLVLGFAFWAVGTRIVLLGASSLEAIGLVLLQTASGYLFGRVLVRDVASTRFAFGMAVGGVLVMTLPLVLESVTGAKLLLNAASVLGPTLTPTHMDPRWGLQRAQGAFEHPILLGVFCASIVSISGYMFRRDGNRVLRWVGPPAAVVSGVMSFSTGALLSMNIQFGLMLWGYLFRSVKNRWKILIWLVIAAYVTVDLLSNRTPFHVFVDYATFNSQSSYNRILIWEFGSAAVMGAPILGHGTDDWERPSYMSPSMDNFWLVIAYRYGLVGLALLAAAALVIIIRMSRRSGPSEVVDMMRRGAIFSLVGTIVAIVSVHLWNNVYVWFMFVLGAVSWMARPESATSELVPDHAPASEPRARSARELRMALSRRRA